MLIRNFEYVIWNRFFHKLSAGTSRLERSGTFGAAALAASTHGPQLDAAEGLGVEMSLRGLADLSRRDVRDPLGPVPRLVEGKSPSLQLEQPFGPLLDGLEVEDPGAGQVSAGAVDLVVAEGP